MEGADGLVGPVVPQEVVLQDGVGGAEANEEGGAEGGRALFPRGETAVFGWWWLFVGHFVLLDEGLARIRRILPKTESEKKKSPLLDQRGESLIGFDYDYSGGERIYITHDTIRPRQRGIICTSISSSNAAHHIIIAQPTNALSILTRHE